jgi:Fe2+ transport system protein FeoA
MVMRRIPDEERCDNCPAFPEKECLSDNVVPLSRFKPGEKGVVFQACGDAELRLRLMEMGFVRGTEVKVVKQAPLRDPLEFVIKGYHVSLRKEEAENILMEKTPKAV